MDTKKKELVGHYKSAGREWQRSGQPVLVKTHDFLDRKGPGKAIPYGIYDWLGQFGIDHDTAAFAVASIHRWWKARGPHDYPPADHRRCGRLQRLPHPGLEERTRCPRL